MPNLRTASPRTRLEEARPESGPERLTLVERLVGLLPVPYLVGSLVVAILVGPGVIVLVRYLATGEVDPVLQEYSRWPSPPAAWQIAGSMLYWTLHTFVVLWAIRFMRTKVVAAQEELAPLLPDGKNAYRRLFGSISRLGPALVISVIVVIVFAGVYSSDFRNAPRTAEQLFIAFRYLLLNLFYGTSVWVYVAALWGLHRLGQQPLKLKPFYEDGRLGVGRAGALSLEVALAYFSNPGVLMLVALVMPVRPEFTATLIALTVLGVILFFLPLNTVHEQMAREKERHQKALRRRFIDSLELRGPGQMSQEPELPDVLADLRNLLSLQAVERQVAAIPTWPFDVGTLGGLAAIVTAILTGVLTDLITNLLQG